MSRAPLHIATCRDWPRGGADQQALAQALGAAMRPWQELPPAACAGAIVLPLAAWDYSLHAPAYRQWLQALQAAGARVLNPPALQLWNMDKRYLCDLAAQGLPITPSLPLLPGQDWLRVMADGGWPQGVVKPLIGQSGRGVRRLAGQPPTADEFPDGALHQDFVPTRVGEVCLIYLAGRFSHAAHRQPAEGEWRANSAYGVQVLPITPRPDWLHAAARVLQALPGGAPVYARIDGLIDVRNRFIVNEVELIEPALYPRLHPQGVPGFAQALQAALG